MFAAGQMLSLKLMSEMKPSAMKIAIVVTSLIGAAHAGMQGVAGTMLAVSGVYFICMEMLWQSSLAKDIGSSKAL